MLAYYVTLGEHDFLVVCEMPGHKEASMVVLTAAASGGVTDVKTTLAMTTAEAKEVFTATGKLALELPSGRRGQLTWLTQPKIG
jgi:uncharacterized protein with GYD domain